MTYKIIEEPKIEDEIINAVNKKNFVVFTGAGVSRLKPIKCLGWDQLAKNLIEKCFPPGKIRYKEKKSLLENNDHRMVITIIQKKLGNDKLFWDEMKNALKENEKVHGINIYKDIYALRGINVTTNADTYIDEYFNPQNVIYKVEGFDPRNINHANVYHLHGSINDPDSMVFTLSQYFKRYQEHNVQQFIKTIIQENVVLFIGYGLGEFELLEYLFLHNRQNFPSTYSRYILKPYYMGEENLLDMDQKYFDDMGITIIPFAIDKEGYEQLAVIIKDWQETINSRSKHVIDSLNSIDEALSHPSAKKIRNVLQEIRYEPKKQEHLFFNFEKAKNIGLWFRHLKEEDYLDVNNIPFHHKDAKSQRTWLPIYYLHEFAIRKNKTHDKQFLDKFYNVINEIIDYEQKVISDNPYAIPYEMERIIFSIPRNRFTEKYIDYLKIRISKDNLRSSHYLFDILIPKLLKFKNKSLLLKVIDLIFSYRKADERSRGYRTTEVIQLIDTRYLPKIVEQYSSKLYMSTRFDGYKIARRKLDKIIKDEPQSFNMITIRAIDDRTEFEFMFTERFEYQLIYFLRNILLNVGKHVAVQELRYLFRRKHPIYTRLALNTIRCRYVELKEYFWEWGISHHNPLDTVDWKHELWELFKDNSKNFSAQEILRVVNWIESKDFSFYRKGDFDDNEIKAGIAYRKREWLLTLIEANHPDVDKLYEKYSKNNPEPFDHPGFDWWIGHIQSPEKGTTPDMLLKMSNAEIVRMLLDFNGPQRHPREGDSVYDLHNVLEYCVREKPERFIADMDLFRDSDFAYTSAILSGFKDAWKAQKDFSWEPIFNFIETFINNDKFWDYKSVDNSYNYRDWMIQSISDLITAGMRYPMILTDLEYLHKAQSILLRLAERVHSDLEFSGDLITSVLNTTRGHVYENLFIYAIEYAKIVKPTESSKWPQPIKDFLIERVIEHPENSPELWINIGRFFNNLLYLDREWILKNLNALFPQPAIDFWKSTFMAYLYFTQTIYGDIYILLRESGHYQKAIYTEFEKVSIDKDIRSSLMTHIALGYLNGWESLEDPQSLINLVLRRKDPVQIGEFVNYFSRLKTERYDPSIQAKLKTLWRELIRILRIEENNKYFQKSIAYLSLFISKFDKLDEEMIEWIVFSAKYTSEYHVSYLLVEYLKSLSKISAVNVASVYLKLLENDIVLDDDKDDIKDTVESIYQAGEKDLADRICIGYVNRGYLFLRDLYEKYNGD